LHWKLMTRPSDFELRVRAEAMAWLTIRTNDGADSISSTELLDFTVDGERFRLMDAQRGIRKPAAFSAALSVRTTYTPPGRGRPYDDRIGADGLLRYKWRGDDADHAENRALRTAMTSELPLIWFFGVGQARYQPVFPVFLLAEDQAEQEFVIDPDVARGLVSVDSPVEETLRRYIVRETKQRLHQPVFRAAVLRAYEKRCAVCRLGHSELLDAAHIIADREESGIASVRNGMAMCKIHHAAYDRHILGVRPDLIVEIRRDLLEEVDGPMLQYGLKERHGQRLLALPRSQREYPDPALLELSYQSFRSAG
jgi:putative restriction endonuclease